jgi:hypothetical protein
LRCVEPSYEEIAAIDALRVACEATSNVVLTFR